MRLELSGSQLSISDVQPSDSGIYSCHAIRASQTLSAQIKFEVAGYNLRIIKECNFDVDGRF